MGRAEDIFAQIERTGEDALRDFIESRASEELFLDFKRSSDSGAGRLLSQTDRSNLSRAVSGFGNSEGGVVIWGVECSPDLAGADVAAMLCPLKDPKSFVSRLESCVSGSTLPPHSGVRSIAVEAADGNGYAATLIPSSAAAPHLALLSRKYYYIRAGSEFAPAPHGVLAGLFGRRPQPQVYTMFILPPPEIINMRSAAITVGIMLRNDGPVIARDVFSCIEVNSLPGEQCSFQILSRDPNWKVLQTLGFHWSAVCDPSVRLPPEAQLTPFAFRLGLKPPFSSDLRIRLIGGANDAPPHRAEIVQSVDALASAFNELVAPSASGTRDKRDIIPELLGLPDPETYLRED